MSDIEYVESVVSKQFAIYDQKIDNDLLHIYVSPISELHEDFDAVRRELVPNDFVPFLTRKDGHYIITVAKKNHINPKSRIVNLVMFILTIISTMAAGAMIWYDYITAPVLTASMTVDLAIKIWANPGNWLYGGIYFAVPLMLILGIHELGHYFMARKHHVAASLPFFIPAPPPFFILGTFGAFISMRDPIPNKRALVEIGAAGPIAGFIVAVPVSIMGILLTRSFNVSMAQVSGNVLAIGLPPLFNFFLWLIPIQQSLSWHPMAFAGWVGLFVTFINLLPAGQLDGGHIARAALGEKAKYVSYGVVIFLFLTGFALGAPTWIMFALLIMLLGMRHPPSLNELEPMGMKQKLITIFSLFMFIVCFVPQPFNIVYVEPEVHSVSVLPPITEYAFAGVNKSIDYQITNMGNQDENIYITLDIDIISPQDLQAVNPDELGVRSEFPHIIWKNAFKSADTSLSNTIQLKSGKDTVSNFTVETPNATGSLLALKMTMTYNGGDGGVYYSGIIINDMNISSSYEVISSATSDFAILKVGISHNTTQPGVRFYAISNVTTEKMGSDTDLFFNDRTVLWYDIQNVNGTWYLLIISPSTLSGEFHVVIDRTGPVMDNYSAANFTARCTYFHLQIRGV